MKNRNYLDYVNSGIHKYTTKYLIKFYAVPSKFLVMELRLYLKKKITAQENPAVIIHHNTTY